MGEKDLRRTSRTNWEALESTDDDTIDYSDIPLLIEIDLKYVYFTIGFCFVNIERAFES